MSDKTKSATVDLGNEAIELIEEKARELAEAVAEASPGPWLQPLEDEQRAIVSAKRPEISLLGLDRDGMAILDREEDATFVVVARSHAAQLSAYVLALSAEVRRLRGAS